MSKATPTPGEAPERRLRDTLSQGEETRRLEPLGGADSRGAQIKQGIKGINGRVGDPNLQQTTITLGESATSEEVRGEVSHVFTAAPELPPPGVKINERLIKSEDATDDTPTVLGTNARDRWELNKASEKLLKKIRRLEKVLVQTAIKERVDGCETVLEKIIQTSRNENWGDAFQLFLHPTEESQTLDKANPECKLMSFNINTVIDDLLLSLILPDIIRHDEQTRVTGDENQVKLLFDDHTIESIDRAANKCEAELSSLLTSEERIAAVAKAMKESEKAIWVGYRNRIRERYFSNE